MHVLKINNILIKVNKQAVFIFDVFGDVSLLEKNYILAYLHAEGFIDIKKQPHVITKTKNFLSVK